MKIRNGFVSNSSSSSFIVAWRGSLNTENVLKALDVNEKSPLYDFAKDLANFIVQERKTIYQNWEQYKDELFIQDNENAVAKQLFDKGLVVADLCASYNEADNPVESYLGSNDYFKIVTDDFVLLGEYAEL